MLAVLGLSFRDIYRMSLTFSASLRFSDVGRSITAATRYAFCLYTCRTTCVLLVVLCSSHGSGGRVVSYCYVYFL